jgi:hypothetical protein
MHWFSKGDHTKFFWEELNEPLGDLEAAKAIRAICKSVSPETQKPKTNGFGRSRHQRNDEQKADLQVRAAKAAMEIALKISDQLVRDAALRQIIGLCMASDNLKAAQILVRAIQSQTIKTDVLNEYPALSQARPEH